MRQFPLRRPVLTITILAGLSAGAALAAADGDRLAALVQQRLGSSGGIGLEWSGAPVVGPEVGGRTRLTFSDARLRLPDGRVVQAGDVTALLAPIDGGLSAALTLPPRMTVYGQAGEPVAELAIGRQAIETRWTADFGTLTAIDLDLSDIAYTPLAGPDDVKLQSLTVRARPTAFQGGRWTGPVKLAARGLQAGGADAPEQLQLSRLDADLTLEGLDMARTGAALADLAGAAGGGLRWAGLLRGGKADVRLAGLSHQQGAERLEVDSAALAATAAGADGNDGRLTFNWTHSGLAAQGRLLPAAATLQGTAQKVPARRLLDRVDAGGGQSFVMAELGKAGTEATLRQANAATPEADLAATGQVRFDAGSPRGMVGRMSGTLRGAEALGRQAGASGGAGTALAVMALQGMGQPGTDPQGRAVRTYEVEVTQPGAVRLNGQDVTGLVTPLLGLRK